MRGYALVSAVYSSFYAMHLVSGHLMGGIVVLRHMSDLAAVIPCEFGHVSRMAVSPGSG
jgi:hypothetical protein